jgi:hypothetical protein
LWYAGLTPCVPKNSFFMKQIMLTKGYFALVDDSDYEVLVKHNWHVAIRKNKAYAVRGIFDSGKRDVIYMHREIMSPPEGMELDHRNGNGLDNQRGNLRVCTRIQNTQNIRLNSNNKSGYKGVYYNDACRRKWIAAINHNKKAYYLGCFATPEEAALAYNQKALEFLVISPP